MDYVIHVSATQMYMGSSDFAQLGDYIYEYETSSSQRHVEPQREIFTLYDYRRRLATYRTDEDLLLSHSKFAWVRISPTQSIAETWLIILLDSRLG